MSDSDEKVLIKAIGPISVTNTAGPPENDSDVMAEGRRPDPCPARRLGKAGQ